jgi:16S rRNA (guanine527-N7)-methyltransferase
LAKPGAAEDTELAGAVFEAARALQLPMAELQAAQLVKHVRLIARWNATYNLTAVREPEQMLSQHILDCLAACAALFRRRDPHRAARVLDVGSGAGLPGLVIAVMAPAWTVVCVDSVGKKAAFMVEAIGQLRLANASALHRRVESLDSGPFDIIASRAFASLEHFVAATRPLLEPSGEWMAMKGKTPVEELERLDPAQFHVEQLRIPGLDVERCIVWISNLAQSECMPSGIARAGNGSLE